MDLRRKARGGSASSILLAERLPAWPIGVTMNALNCSDHAGEDSPMRTFLLIAVALVLASPLAAQNEAPPDSTATESRRSHRVTVGLLIGVTGGALVGLRFRCNERPRLHIPLDQQDLCAEGRISLGWATLIGAAVGALVGFAVDVEATGRAQLRAGPDRIRPRRFAVEIQMSVS